MTPRSRQHERLRSLGLDPADGPRPLHESPAARRLRSRIPRPPLSDSPVPAAPYAVDEAGTEYRPQVARNMASPAHRRSSVPTPRHHAASGADAGAPEGTDAAQSQARGGEPAGGTSASANPGRTPVSSDGTGSADPGRTRSDDLFGAHVSREDLHAGRDRAGPGMGPERERGQRTAWKGARSSASVAGADAGSGGAGAGARAGAGSLAGMSAAASGAGAAPSSASDRVPGSESASRAAEGSEESTPLTEFLEESDTERLPPPARAGAGRAEADTPGPAPASTHVRARARTHERAQAERRASARGAGSGQAHTSGHAPGRTSGRENGDRHATAAPGSAPASGTHADEDTQQPHAPLLGSDRAGQAPTDTHDQGPATSARYASPTPGRLAPGTHEPVPHGDGRPEHPGHVRGPSSTHVTGAFARRPAGLPDRGSGTGSGTDREAGQGSTVGRGTARGSTPGVGRARAHVSGSDDPEGPRDTGDHGGPAGRGGEGGKGGPAGSGGEGGLGPDDMLEDHDTTRLRPARVRVPGPRPPQHTPSDGWGQGSRSTASEPEPPARAGTAASSAGRDPRSGPVLGRGSAREFVRPGYRAARGSEHGSGHAPDHFIDPRLWNEPPISAQVLRHHRDLTPDTLPSGVPGTVPLGGPGTVTPGSDTPDPWGSTSPSGADGAHAPDGASGPGTSDVHSAYAASEDPGPVGRSGSADSPAPGISTAPSIPGTTGTTVPFGTGDATAPPTLSAPGERLEAHDELDDLRQGSGTVRLRPRQGPVSSLPSREGDEPFPRGRSAGAPRDAADRGAASFVFGSANRPAATFDDMFPGPRFPDPHGPDSPDPANTSAPSIPSGLESAVRIPAADVRGGRSRPSSTPPDLQGRQDRRHRPDRRSQPDSPDRQPATSRTPTTRRWVGHRPLGEQPREYRRPSWPTDPTSELRSETPAHGSPSHGSASGNHPSDDPPHDGPWNASLWPERDPADSVTLPDAPEFHIPAPPDSPWLDPDDEETLKERRPPSGYVEFDPRDPADAPVNRLARLWGPNATLSKRAVIALFVLGAAAVVAALLFLRREPEDVDVPEMVPQSAPDGEDGETGNGGQGSAGNGDSGDGPTDAPGDGSGEDVVVHIGGDVEDPGLYTLPSGSRVLDAVEEAGGALPDADLDMVNLARPVVDGERILLGAEGDPDAAEAAEGGDAQRVSLNQADQSALEALPGIGEAKAGAILEHRESLGGSFSSVEDLLDVSGIGQSTFDNLEDHVTL